MGLNNNQYIARYRIWYIFIFFILSCFPIILVGQSHNYWTRSFNEESSLLSGAVVGGGAGPSAIYFNPASISEINESKFSLHASLFSIEFLNIKNALGNGIDLKSTRGMIEPRFISYMIKPKKHPDWSFEFAFLNNENYYQQLMQSVDYEADVLTNIPGNERYFALFQYNNRYRDDWFGAGGSWKINPNLFIGASMFATIRQLEYDYSLEIEVFPQDSVFIDDDYIPFYAAGYTDMEYLKYNDYRLLWKVGILYKRKHISFGLSITSPSVGGIYSDGKRVTRKLETSNITNPETGEQVPNHLLVAYKEKKDVTVNDKSPFSVAAGVTISFSDTSKILYTTVEYFAGLDPYRLAKGNIDQGIYASSVLQEVVYNEWLTFASGAKPVFNAAIGYQWYVKENLMMMTGFRTDFNYRKDLDYNPYYDVKKVKGLDLNIYHITGGLSWRIMGQDLITGLQYTFGRERNKEQYANLTEPNEYNNGSEPLQGQRQNTMDVLSNSISIYFGATFNFGGDKNK